MRITASLRTFCHLSPSHSESTITRLWIDEVTAVARQRDRDSFMRIYDHFAPRLLQMGNASVATPSRAVGAPPEVRIRVIPAEMTVSMASPAFGEKSNAR